MIKEKVSFEQIEEFLQGRDPQKYIVGIEATYYENFVSLIVNDPVKGKRVEQHAYKPFLWLKHEVSQHIYGGNRREIKKAMNLYGVKLNKVRSEDSNGITPKRFENGYNFMAVCKKGSYSKLIQFFKAGGVDIFNEKHKKMFVAFPPAEQFLIQTGKRLFKGMDDYNDVHRFQFDLETEGLKASVDPIFQIGIKDNKGFELVLETKGDTPQKRRDSERINIIKFFELIDEIRPDLISGYNSENFDWPYFKRRCERLGIDIEVIAKTLNPDKKIYWRDSMLKLGGESQAYQQTSMWGYNILDISHSVRRAQAINSNIKSWSLKYITQYSGVAKPNRVYVPGDKLHTIWSDTNPYWFNDTDGSWGVIGERGLPKGSVEVKGDYIVQRYLIDDLWETEQIDVIYNQAAYLIAKLLPTSYTRSSTMGTAGQWKLIMAAWSYENKLAIPELEKKRNFTGGLARLLEVGYAKNVIKLDFAALYPKTQLTHGIFPSLDISGVMEGLLTYVVDTRDKFKFLTGTHKGKAKELQELLDKNIDKLTPERIAKGKEMIKAEKKLASDYDKKQLPLKILANSFFGAYGAPYIFNWGDTDSAEETTCRGRQYLRLMVKHFTEGYGFRPLVGDTDGFNFAIPDNVDTFSYTCTGEHWKTDKYENGTLLTGLEAVLAEFNEKYMMGRMGLDIDDICSSTINFARKNYANAIDGKVKLVGNSIKSKAMPIYIEEFIDEGMKMLLDGDGYSFINLYYKVVDKIYNYKIPVLKIASKSKVKMTVDNYKNVYCKQKNKAGRYKNRQAHMELIIKDNINVDLGDVVYYVNTGLAKSHSDIKKITDKETGNFEIQYNSKLIPQSQIDANPDLTTDEYNVAKYLAAFNARVEKLLVCFSEEIRDDIIINVFKDRKTKLIKLQDRSVFTEKQCELTSGNPLEEKDQDSYEALMVMEDKEIRFWDSVNKIPNNIEIEEWLTIRDDWKERMRVERLNGIAEEKQNLYELIMRLEVKDLNMVKEGILPKDISKIVFVSQEEDGTFMLKSLNWEECLFNFDMLFTYESDAMKREVYYKTLEGEHDPSDMYEMWLEYDREKTLKQYMIDKKL
tara:strand:- start:11564 stop:14815 length:3252 start_codon:yes stop_codon:yes gene_type:complete